MIRCHLGCLRSIRHALLNGALTIWAARRRASCSGPGTCPRSSGSGWLMTGRSWSRCVPVRRGSRRAWKSSAASLGDGVATAEAHIAGGAMLPGAARSAWAFAEAFARLIVLAPRPAEVSALDPPPSWAAWSHTEPGQWPHPEDDDVNLNDVAGPVWIDDAGRCARDRLHASASGVVIGHCDWLAGNLRWSGDTLLVVHDWDSVTADSEAVLVGLAAALYSTVNPDELATV